MMRNRLPATGAWGYTKGWPPPGFGSQEGDTMKAAVMEDVRKTPVVRDKPDPECPPNGAIIKTAAEGICRSDWHLWSGDWTWVGLTPSMPMIMGHEFCGVIQEVGKEVKDFKKGDRVLVPFSQGDGTCELCRSGN